MPDARLVPVDGGCWWPAPDYPSCCPDAASLIDDTGVVDARLAIVERAAASWLYRASYGRYPGRECDRIIRPPTDCCRCVYCRCTSWGELEPIHIAPPGVLIDPQSLQLWICGTQVEEDPDNPCRIMSLRHTERGTYLIRTDGNPWPSGQALGGDPITGCACPTSACCGTSWGVRFCWSAEPESMGMLAFQDLVCYLVSQCPNDDEGCGCDNGDDFWKPKPGVESVSAGGITARFSQLVEWLAKSDTVIRTGIPTVDLFLRVHGQTWDPGLLDPATSSPFDDQVIASGPYVWGG